MRYMLFLLVVLMLVSCSTPPEKTVVAKKQGAPKMVPVIAQNQPKTPVAPQTGKVKTFPVIKMKKLTGVIRFDIVSGSIVIKDPASIKRIVDARPASGALVITLYINENNYRDSIVVYSDGSDLTGANGLQMKLQLGTPVLVKNDTHVGVIRIPLMGQTIGQWFVMNVLGQNVPCVKDGVEVKLEDMEITQKPIK